MFVIAKGICSLIPLDDVTADESRSMNSLERALLSPQILTNAQKHWKELHNADGQQPGTYFESNPRLFKTKEVERSTGRIL